MDTFSWFVGIFEGEGSFDVQTKRKTVNGKVYEFPNIRLVIKMTDEDTIAKCAEFLGVGYHVTDKKYTERMGRKTIYRVVKCGGKNGKLRDLLERMRPHLSQRRQEQLDTKLANIFPK